MSSPDVLEPNESQSSPQRLRFCTDERMIILGVKVSSLD